MASGSMRWTSSSPYIGRPSHPEPGSLRPALHRRTGRGTLWSALRILSWSSSRGGKEEVPREWWLTLRDGDGVRLVPGLQRRYRSGGFRDLCEDILEAARMKNADYEVESPLKIGKKYGYKDVCRLLNWDQDETSTRGIPDKAPDLPIFITYNKSPEVDGAIKYEDEFLDRRNIRWFSKHTRNLGSKDVSQILNHKTSQTTLHIFVKKSDKEDKGASKYYYLGIADLEDGSEREEKMPENGKDVVTMQLSLREEVPVGIYEYIVS